MVFVELWGGGLWAVGVRNSKGKKKVAKFFKTEDEAWKYAQALNDVILATLKKTLAGRQLPC